MSKRPWTKIAKGTTCDDHHSGWPSGEGEFPAYAERMSKTHDQRRCGECGLWFVWLPKEATDDQ